MKKEHGTLKNVKKAVKNKKERGIVIYQAKTGAIELRGDFEEETLWATQLHIAKAFNVDIRTINEHIGNIYKTKELPEKATIRKFRIVQKEGNREVEREVKHYNLDVILSVGYRVNSKKATAFRQWATKTLRQHIVDGYTINKTRIAANYDAFMEAVDRVKTLLPVTGSVGAGDALELIILFADTWFSLDAYDKGTLTGKGITKKKVVLTVEALWKDIYHFKAALMESNEATELFAAEKNTGSLEGIVGNVLQSFAGQELYPTVEEKAAHLLYFIIKNHPFNDGNKRTGAYTFIWYLKKAKLLDIKKFTPQTLTALALLVAESDPKNKQGMIDLIVALLAGPNIKQ